ncbi:class I SAM-dependent methyltransferase [Nonomuraea sp. SYSU D8015]|uniref:class I SAM-dependent methyltransferase n=1 Tax=Nonomuraea sp. SYSU D8015 TaxID=2593644 RepID=UPI001660F2D7|nr:class I SAM-dependent methyltransferase [Nonomuraea sp. SYSU D8015]
MRDHVIVLDENRETGRRLKYYSQVADAAYWTDLWKSKEWSYDRQLAGHLPHQLRSTFSRFVEPGARVLEAGCGMGHFTVAARVLGYRAEGLDWSSETIEELRRRFPEIPWHVGDVRKLECDDGSFDAVYSPGVCEHFEEGPVQILRETQRILRPGGIAIITTPCFNRWLQARADRFTPTAERTGEFYQFAFSPEGMRRLLEDLQFEVPFVRTYDTVDTFIQFAGWRLPPWAIKPLAIMDYLPVLRHWGRCCVWVARRPAGLTIPSGGGSP